MRHDQVPIVEPLKIRRVCEPSIPVEQLALKEVDSTESVYTRRMVQLKDASLPSSILHDGVQGPGIVAWDLFLVLKYRQDWKSTGYGLGDLLYTISMLPNEELTLEVKTWETSKTQQDTEDSTDVRNVSDIKQSSSAANEVTTGEEVKTNTHIDAKAGYSGFGFSASVEGGWSEDVNRMQQEVAKETQESSQQATNEYRATHKVKLAVSREEGSESKTTRKIRNINQAHTLNANYYEVLREYEIELDLYAVHLALLGAEVDLAQAIEIPSASTVPQVVFLRRQGQEGGSSTPPGTNRPVDPSGSWVVSKPGSGAKEPDPEEEPLTIGQLLRFSHSPAWVQDFIDRFGISPIKVLWSLWSNPLYDAALVAQDITNDQTELRPEDREDFQSTMLQFVRPTDGWVEMDEKGEFRWAYEVRPGQEQALLEYLYPFLPFGVQQLIQRATLAGMELATSYRAVATRTVEATHVRARPAHAYQGTWSLAARPAETTPPLKVAPTDQILVPGPFSGMHLERFSKAVGEWSEGIMEQLDQVKETIGVQRTWRTTLPTQGVYADLSLGICSGAEDYYELQRQFDLELKRQEIAKLALEVEKLQLQNELLKQGKSPSKLVIDHPEGETSLNLYLSTPESPTTVQVGEEGA